MPLYAEVFLTTTHRHACELLELTSRLFVEIFVGTFVAKQNTSVYTFNTSGKERKIKIVLLSKHITGEKGTFSMCFTTKC